MPIPNAKFWALLSSLCLILAQHSELTASYTVHIFFPEVEENIAGRMQIEILLAMFSICRYLSVYPYHQSHMFEF